MRKEILIYSAQLVILGTVPNLLFGHPQYIDVLHLISFIISFFYPRGRPVVVIISCNLWQTLISCLFATAHLLLALKFSKSSETKQISIVNNVCYW